MATAALELLKVGSASPFAIARPANTNMKGKRENEQRRELVEDEMAEDSVSPERIVNNAAMVLRR